MRKSDAMGYSILPYVTWCRERGGKCHLVRLLRNCYLGLESRLCLPACAHLQKLSRGHCRVITKDFALWGWCPLGPLWKLCLLCRGDWSGNGGGDGI